MAFLILHENLHMRICCIYVFLFETPPIGGKKEDGGEDGNAQS